MKNKVIALALSILFAMPCILRAEEQVIQLFSVVEVEFLPGENPLDNPIQSGENPPRPTDFRASINGNSLSVTKENEQIPSANVLVVHAASGNMAVNQSFSSSLSVQIPTVGTHWLTIQTSNGALTGMFIVQ